MPFASRFQEAGEAEFIENLMVLLNRDMKSALDLFYPGDQLPAFAVMSDGPLSVFNYPLLVFLDEDMTSNETEAGSYLSQDLRVTASMAVKAITLKLVRATARKYIRAFKAVIRSAQASELLPLLNDLEHVIDVRHQFQPDGDTKDGNKVQPVTFEIRVRFSEV